MSLQTARFVLDRMNFNPVLLSPLMPSLNNDLRLLANADTTAMENAEQTRRNEMCAAFGYNTSSPDKPFAYADGVAIIPIHGMLINRFGYSWGWVTGYNAIRKQRNAALEDPDVKLIVYDVNSYGGEAAGCPELAQEMYDTRDAKPSLAVVDSNCFSAAYWLSSACGRVVLTPSGGVGSIGVVSMHASYEKMLTDAGIEITFIFAGEHKVDGNPFEALSKSAKVGIKKAVDAVYTKFVDAVARNRDLDPQDVRDTKADVFRAEDALELGLIDAVSTPTEAVSAFMSELSGSDPEEDDTMTDKKTGGQEPAALTAEQTAAAATAERERIKAITTCDEAKDRPTFARHLAFETTMSTDDAKKMLAASAKEVTEQPKPAPGAEQPPPTSPKPSAFQRAMDNGQNPNVGADGGDEGNGEQRKSSRILADYHLASGTKPRERVKH